MHTSPEADVMMIFV